MKMDLHGGNVYRIEKEYAIKREEILDYSANINPFGVPESLKKTLYNNFHNLIHYPDPDYIDLKKAIGEYNKTEIEQIIPGNGASELISLYMRVLSPRKVLIISPSYAEYERAVKITGGTVNYFQLKEEENFNINLEELKKALNFKYDLLVIGNPNNPTGTFTEKEQLKCIIDIAFRYDTSLMIDEAFIEFVERGFERSSASLINEYDNLFIIRSMTKFFAIPGLRLGYGLGNQYLIKHMASQKDPWTINNFAALGGEILLLDKDYINKTTEWINTERDYMYKEMSQIKGLKCYPPSANFMLIGLFLGIKAWELGEKLIKKGILIRNCSNFPFLDEHYIRIAIRDRESNNRIIKEFKDLELKP